GGEEEQASRCELHGRRMSAVMVLLHAVHRLIIGHNLNHNVFKSVRYYRTASIVPQQFCTDCPKNDLPTTRIPSHHFDGWAAGFSTKHRCVASQQGDATPAATHGRFLPTVSDVSNV